MPQPPPESASFCQVLRDELAAIAQRRQTLHEAEQAEAAPHLARWGRAQFTQLDESTEWADPILKSFLNDADLVRSAQAYARCFAGNWRSRRPSAGWTPGSVLGWVGDALRERRFRGDFAQVYRERFQREPTKKEIDDAVAMDDQVERDARRVWRGGREDAAEAPLPDHDSFAALQGTRLWLRWKNHDRGARRVDENAGEGSAEASSWRRMVRDDALRRAMTSHFKARVLRDRQWNRGGPESHLEAVREALIEQYYAQFRGTWLGKDWEWGVINGDSSEQVLAEERRNAMEAHLAGLAFSGGGVRSATFAVGVMQGLSSLKLLRWFDILSTVSGGGYAGGWLTAWIAREGDPLNVERQLGTSRIDQAEADRAYLAPRTVVEEEPEPLRHLRQYSSYLNPRPGLFSIDTWAVIAIYFRNLTINLLLLIPTLLLGVFVLHGLAWMYDLLLTACLAITPASVKAAPHFSQVQAFALALGRLEPLPYVAFTFGLGALLVLFGFLYNARALRRLRNGESGDARPGAAYLTRLVVLPILFGAILLAGVLPAALDYLREVVWLDLTRPGRSLSIIGWLARQVFGAQPNAPRDVAGAYYLSWPNVLIHAVVCGLAMFALAVLQVVCSWLWEKPALRQSRHHRARGTLYPPFAALLAGVIGGASLAAAEEVLRPVQRYPWLMLAVGPPALLLVVALAVTALVALLNRRADESEREWWASFSARLLWMGTLWTLLILVVGYGPALLMTVGGTARAFFATGWAGLTAVAGRFGYLALGKREGGGKWGGVFLAAAPSLVLAGLLAGLSMGATALLIGGVLADPMSVWQFAEHSLGHVKGANPLSKWTELVVKSAILAAFLAGSLSWISVNLFSLNAFYTNRLVRCFLGASRPRADWETRWGRHRRPSVAGAPTHAVGPNRAADRVTGFDENDDLPLADLVIGGQLGQGENARRYWGPHYLVNTSLSLIAGDELAWRDRKAASFVLSPLYCGSKVTGYAPTTRTRESLSLGRSMAISGAAVDPGMSYYQSSALTALLTILNIRLGHWVRNPGPDRQGETARPWLADEPSGTRLLIHELAGTANARGEYIRLTDGGNFENLGVYELLRRRVRYIVTVDATENPNATSDNLGILVRLARVDFGIRIQLDTSPLAVTLPDQLSRAHVSIGRIRYDDVDKGQMPGILVYVRATMTGDEPPDVQQYANTHPAFPREGTLDQSFSENQFESYRALGEHVAQTIFESAARELLADETTTDAPNGRELFIRSHRRMFASLRNLWSNPPLDQDERAMQATRAWVTLQRDLRGDPKLDALSRDLYPELDPLPPRPSDRDRAELHAMEQMLQTMEDGWLGLGMKGYPDLPMNRGWMNSLRRLAASATFRKFWPVLRAQHSPEFVRFCEEQLRLQVDPPRLRPLAAGDPALSLLGAEFAREWPREVGLPNAGQPTAQGLDQAGTAYLERWIAAAIPYGPADQPPLGHASWLITLGPIGHLPATEPGLEFPMGLLTVSKPQGPPCDDPPADVELFLWVRRAHRSARVGDLALREMMRTVNGAFQRPLRVRVRFPGDVEVNLEHDRDLWLNFFSTFDFKPALNVGQSIGGELILYRTL